MPELPEIETIRHVIEPQITGLAIEKATVLRPEVIAHPAADEFCKAVTGQTVLAMERRGKYLIFHLTQKSRVILHLRMTGCLLRRPAAQWNGTRMLCCNSAMGWSCAFPTRAASGAFG
ncbi:MAG: DNA-formamidopyrimidine glycosylase family protein [Ruthenibacterium sp.]